MQHVEPIGVGGASPLGENKFYPQKIKSVRGMRDVLPKEEILWSYFEDVIQSIMVAYGYQQIRTPIVEDTQLFSRGIGSGTDVVDKEMYSFKDELNGDLLTLRPENTAGVVRSVIEHHLLYDGPKRLWYQGPMFRHERPQKGRYRQFHQVGAEAIGWFGPDVDVELIVMSKRILEELGVKASLQINSLGSSDARKKYREILQNFLRKNYDRLDADSKVRLETNPLRVLDTKNPEMKEIIEKAPSVLEYIDTESALHFEEIQCFLKDLGVLYTINPRLVRGLDYYSKTVFEWVSDFNGTELTVCGGGRYDSLLGLLGGASAPASGFALGVERILALMPELDCTSQCDVYVAYDAPDRHSEALYKAMHISERLRNAGLRVVMHCGRGSFKQQFKRADAHASFWVAILGSEELDQGSISLRALCRRGNYDQSKSQQENFPLEEAIQKLIDWKKKASDEKN